MLLNRVNLFILEKICKNMTGEKQEGERRVLQRRHSTQTNQDCSTRRTYIYFLKEADLRRNVDLLLSVGTRLQYHGGGMGEEEGDKELKT